MDTRLSLELVQCRQFDPVSGPFSMNNERKDETQSVYTIGSQRNLVPVRSRHAYLKRRSELPKLVLVILYFAVASLLTTVVVLSVLYALKREMRLCDTENCMRIAASLKESMDTSVDPCDDFYKYTCGRWSNEHPIPDSGMTNSWFEDRAQRVSRKIREQLEQNITSENAPWAVLQAKTLYTSCMDVDAMDELGLTPLFELLEELTLPSIPPAFTKKTTNYIEQMARVKRILGTDVFFGFGIVTDPKNNTRNVMVLDTPEKSSPLPINKELEKRLQLIRSRLRRVKEDPDDPEDTEFEEKSHYQETELTYINEVIKQVVRNGTVDSCSSDDDSQFPTKTELKEVAGKVYDISNTIYALHHSENNQNKVMADIMAADYMLVDDLQKLTDEYVTEVNSTLTPRRFWRTYIELVFKDVVTLDLDREDKILVGDLDFLKDVALTMTLLEEEDIETYIWWSVVDILVPYSSESLRKVWAKYIDDLTDVEISEPKSLQCASSVNQLMGMAVSWLFVDPDFHDSKSNKVREMLDDIKQAFASVVMKTKWMDLKTKIATLEKNKKMLSQIGFPRWLFDKEMLDEYYTGIDLSETDYLDNMIQLLRWLSICSLEYLHEMNEFDDYYWVTDPTDVNAFHTYQYNQITIPAGILQFPFYELGLEALNYGAIGTVLGHELTHGFDNSGRYYDSDGNLKLWWTNESISEYSDKTKCFVAHYSTYYEDEVNDYIDGELTLDENIADNGGLREAVIAYERWKARHGQEPLLPGFTHFTHEQLFFLSFAHLWCEAYTSTSLKWMLLDSHSPAHVRLQAVLKNSEEFSKAWKCPAGSKMNPREKCHLW